MRMRSAKSRLALSSRAVIRARAATIVARLTLVVRRSLTMRSTWDWLTVVWLDSPRASALSTFWASSALRRSAWARRSARRARDASLGPDALARSEARDERLARAASTSDAPE